MPLADTVQDIQMDIDTISRIPIVPTIFEVICRTTGMGFAAIARVTDDQWVACAVRDDIHFGLSPGGELALETTICNEIRQHHQPVIIDHVEKDASFCSHHTPAMYGFQSYISIPIIRKDGSFFGTLCAIDPKPAKLKNPETIGMFMLFADLISFHISAYEEKALAEANFLAERKTAELREQFIAILGHDLRNPAGSIQMGTQLLLEFPLQEEVKQIVNAIKNSSYRITGLIENILDFAHGRLGDGIILHRVQSNTLHKTLNHIVRELLTIHPGRVIETDFDFPVPVYCDESRIAQLFSNLLTNAIIHGDRNMPVRVNASSNENEFSLSVTNYGKRIPLHISSVLFQPFHRDSESGNKGLGLGLFIAAEIAKAHNGKLSVSSTEERTVFTLQVPLKRPDPD